MLWRGVINVESELLQEILAKITSLDDKFISLEHKVTSLDDKFVSLEHKVTSLDDKFVSLEHKVDSGFTHIDKRLTQLSTDVSNVLSQEIVQTISTQLHDIKTELTIIKSSVGEHEMDIKYLKKAK